MGSRWNDEVDPQRDLVLERWVELPPEKVFEAWTRPEHLVHWFTPKPWVTTSCEMDPRPGGGFTARMRSPEGKEVANEGCYLEVVKGRRLVWTDALTGGYRPSGGGMPFTAILTMKPKDGGTLYRVIGRHPDAATKQRHEGMGFHQGWGIALEQMVAYMKGQP